MASSVVQRPKTAEGLAWEDTTLRAGFVRKVYGILAAQMVVTVVVAAACTLNVSAQNLVLKMVTMKYLGWLVLIPTLVCLGGLHVKKNIYPWNYYLLLGLTLCISFNVGAVCAVLSGVGLARTILQAAGITLSIFVGLSAYAFYCKRDFSFLKAALSFSLWGLVVAGLASCLLGSSLVESVCAWFGAVLFCAYIVYDTQKLATKSGYDDYITVAAEIYLDIVNLFMYIVELLVKDKERKS